MSLFPIPNFWVLEFGVLKQIKDQKVAKVFPDIVKVDFHSRLGTNFWTKTNWMQMGNNFMSIWEYLKENHKKLSVMWIETLKQPNLHPSHSVSNNGIC